MCEAHKGQTIAPFDCPLCTREALTELAAASDDGAARPPGGYDKPSPCYSDEYYLAMAALDMYPVRDDGLGKSTSVIFRIHQLGHELEAARKRISVLETSVDSLRYLIDHPVKNETTKI